MKPLSGAPILVADDDPDIRDILNDTLNSLGFRVSTAANGQECLDRLEREGSELLLLDIEMPNKTGLEVLKEIRQRAIDVTVIMITAYGTIERAVQAMKQGAFDFITKPFELDHVAVVVEKALERERLKRSFELFTTESSERYRLVGAESSKMRDALETARKAAASKATVLLLGESGTGKEVFARAIHNWSERKQRPFIAINCVGLSKELLESELFGHEKGAFTGAHQLKKGKIEIADGGTVFLDEVGDVSPEIQAKLLRFIQEREFERVGGTKPIRVEVRILAATNRDLATSVRDGQFREDLYHRLNVILITLPPLRARRADIPELCRYYLQRLSLEAKRNFNSITDEALEKLVAYDWPGNVRELANVIEQAVVLGQGPSITVAELAPRVLSYDPGKQLEISSYREAVDNFKRELLLKALAQSHGNRIAAAKTLRLHEKSLIRLIRALRIHTESRENK
jgi:DNA-binding NtrC family response regulator